MVGAIAELSATQANIDIIKTEDGLAPLIRLINTNGPELLVNVSRALGECANDKDALERMRKQDGVRLLWSLLKHSSERVQVWRRYGTVIAGGMIIFHLNHSYLSHTLMERLQFSRNWYTIEISNLIQLDTRYLKISDYRQPLHYKGLDIRAL